MMQLGNLLAIARAFDSENLLLLQTTILSRKSGSYGVKSKEAKHFAHPYYPQDKGKVERDIKCFRRIYLRKIFIAVALLSG